MPNAYHMIYERRADVRRVVHVDIPLLYIPDSTVKRRPLALTPQWRSLIPNEMTASLINFPEPSHAPQK